MPKPTVLKFAGTEFVTSANSPALPGLNVSLAPGMPHALAADAMT